MIRFLPILEQSSTFLRLSNRNKPKLRLFFLPVFEQWTAERHYSPSSAGGERQRKRPASGLPPESNFLAGCPSILIKLRLANPMRPVCALRFERIRQPLIGAPQLRAQPLRQRGVLGVIGFILPQPFRPI